MSKEEFKTEEGTTKGASKKEQNKLARKEKRTGGAATGNDVSVFTIIIAKEKDVALAPSVTRAIELLFPDTFPKTRYSYNLDGKKNLPTLYLDATFSSSITGDANIARFIARSNPALIPLYGNNDLVLAAQIDQWLELYSLTTISPSYHSNLIDVLESFLPSRTYLVGHALSLADVAIYIAFKRLNVTVTSSTPHTARWANLIAAALPDLNTPLPITFVPQPNTVKQSGKDLTSSAGKGEKPASANKDKAVATSTVVADNSAVEDGGTCPPLENAVEGAVCTRFPPEPSGYLHIGHAKAVLLNQYYAQRYNGRLLVRFDDTNPSKEKEEFEENILQDLATLGVKADKVSHSSDHFEVLENYARQMIKDGNAYMDDTDQETMQAERMKQIESKRRNATVEENLQLFEALLKGETTARKYCLRAKIDMTSVNGTMRDPVLYRFNDTPHHRTGTKFKAYPTYDFACPLIDSIEGVTHALRTTEYNDRDEQYHWIQHALGLRHVYIQAFGKMNFVNTVLSKRKLTWFVENKLVESWFDPRFPTVQGCIRRGVNVDALKNFIISQGASRRVITMEWDKFWAENKKVLEEKCPRYMGVSLQDVVELTVENVPDEITFHTVQVHPQRPDHGNRVMRRNKKIYVDQIDAVTYAVGEEITFLRWGNFRITEIERDAGGKVISLKAIYDETATNFSKTKKATWLAVVPENVPCKFVEFDHLIAKAKLGDEEDFKDFVNPVTRVESDGLADASLRLVSAGTVIQLERKGFYRVDKEYGGSPDRPAILFAIPDGKSKSLNPVIKESSNPSVGKTKGKK